MDCQTFDSWLLDALYGELEPATSNAMGEHAAGCSSCAARLERLDKTRSLFRSALEEAPPHDLEERILAAANAAMDATGDGARAPAVLAKPRDESERESESGGGKVVAFLSRPQLAMAAAFVLVLGATAFLLKGTTREASAPTAALDEQKASAPVEPPEPAATMTTTIAPPAACAVAMAEAAPTVAPPGAPVGRAADAEDARLAKAKGKRDASAFAEAKALYDAGNYAAALPKLEALAAHDPEAELYVARVLAHTKGCAAAAPRFDSAASRMENTESASRARLEAARCYKTEGQAQAARARYGGLTKDPHVGPEANAELGELTPKASVHAGPPPAKPVATQATQPAKPQAKPTTVDMSR